MILLSQFALWPAITKAGTIRPADFRYSRSRDRSRRSNPSFRDPDQRSAPGPAQMWVPFGGIAEMRAEPRQRDFLWLKQSPAPAALLGSTETGPASPDRFEQLGPAHFAQGKRWPAEGKLEPGRAAF